MFGVAWCSPASGRMQPAGTQSGAALLEDKAGWMPPPRAVPHHSCQAAASSSSAFDNRLLIIHKLFSTPKTSIFVQKHHPKREI